MSGEHDAEARWYMIANANDLVQRELRHLRRRIAADKNRLVQLEQLAKILPRAGEIVADEETS